MQTVLGTLLRTYLHSLIKNIKVIRVYKHHIIKPLAYSYQLLVTKLFVLGIFYLVLLSSCSKTVSPTDLKSYVENPENGLNQHKQVGGINFNLQFKPAVYRYLQHQDSETFQDSLIHVTLTLSHPEEDIIKVLSTSKEEYLQTIYYFSYGFEKDIYVEVDGRKLPCQLYHFERSYDLKKSRNFVLAFDDTQTNQDKVIVIDSSLLQTGPVKFKITQKSLKAIPEVDLESLKRNKNT